MIFKILYYLTAGVCGLVGVPTFLFNIKSELRYIFVSHDYPLDFAPIGIFFGGLLTLASYFLFTR